MYYTMGKFRLLADSKQNIRAQVSTSVSRVAPSNRKYDIFVVTLCCTLCCTLSCELDFWVLGKTADPCQCVAYPLYLAPAFLSPSILLHGPLTLSPGRDAMVALFIKLFWTQISRYLPTSSWPYFSCCWSPKSRQLLVALIDVVKTLRALRISLEDFHLGSYLATT